MQKYKIHYQQGFGLILALLVILILSILGLSIVLSTQIENVASQNYSRTISSTYASQAAIERFKPYLLYDFKYDFEGWGNEFLLVPKGTPGASPGADIGKPDHDYFDLSNGGTITAPGQQPYDLLDTIVENQMVTLFAAATVPVYTPPIGYQILLRNLGDPGAFAFDQICIEALGFTGESRNLIGGISRQLNLIENCLLAEDISIWNNIVFAEEGTNSGGGNMSAHGNIHILGVGIDPDDVSFTTKADAFNCYECGGQGSLSATGLNIYLNNTQATRQTLNAKVRIRNGTIDLTTGNAWVAPPSSPEMEAAYVCESCANGGYVSDSQDKVRALEYAGYDIPAELQTLVHLPKVADSYQDSRTGITYSNYTAFLIGDDVTTDPGTLALKTASALGNDATSFFQNSTSLATNIWNARNALFDQNANSIVSAAQQPLDPVGAGDSPPETDPLFNPTIGSGPTDGKTFLLVASDPSEGVFVLYKEVAPFERNFKSFSRAVHGMVFAPSGANMSTVQLKVDLDGNDVDGDAINYIWDSTDACAPPNPPHCNATLNNTDSNRLIRKVVNALWRASQGACGFNSTCYTTSSPDNFDASMNLSSMSDNDLSNGNLDTAATGTILVGYGVIQTTDSVSMDDVTYNGRFTVFIDDSNAGGVAGDTTLTDEIVAVPSYQYAGNWYAFPCQINMGILTRNQLTQDAAPHSHRVGSFYGGEVIHVSKQLRILGAMVTDTWEFEAGGNPDFHQAMEIARCLPPYMIGGELIPLLKSNSWVER